jgi:FOG: WD40 repeat
MRGNTLVTGGSDGSVRIWSLEKMAPIHRLAAHDNSVTSLQFDDTRVVSGGSDGRVKVWDLKTGQAVRELVTQCDAVWRVAFEDEKCVAMALKNNRTIMEVSTVKFQRNPEIKNLSLIGCLGLGFLPSRGDASRAVLPFP